MRGALQLGVGGAFGLVLSRSGAASFDAMAEMFRLQDFHLFGVAIVTTALTASGFWLLKRSAAPRVSAIVWPTRHLHKGSVIGAAVFGIGWAVSGMCPGTALVALGHGHLVALATVAGIVLGAFVFRFVNARWLQWPTGGC